MRLADANILRAAFAEIGATELVVRLQWYTSRLAPWNRDADDEVIERDYSGAYEIVGRLPDGRRLHCETVDFARRVLRQIPEFSESARKTLDMAVWT